MDISPSEGAAFGVEITDVDLRTVTVDEFARLKAAWNEAHLLIVRDQVLDPDEQMELACRFGDLAPVATASPDAPPRQRYVMDVTNVHLEDARSYLPDGEMHFHIDTCYFETPYAACFLYGITVPPEGGETLFGDLAAAYEDLPDDVKEAIAGKRALHVYDYEGPKDARMMPGPEAPRFAHPVVVQHPETGRPNLFLSRLLTFAEPGQEPVDETMLEMLFGHVEADKYTYEHRWTEGDLVVWDNRCVSHARRDFDPSHPRHLRRVSVAGTRPLAAAS